MPKSKIARKTNRAPHDIIMNWAAPLRWHPLLAADLRAAHEVYLAERRGQLRPRHGEDDPVLLLVKKWLRHRYEALWASAPPLPRGNLDRALSMAVTRGAWWPVGPQQLVQLRARGGPTGVRASLFLNGADLCRPWLSPDPDADVQTYGGDMPPTGYLPSPLKASDWSQLADLAPPHVPRHMALVLHLFDHATLDEAKAALETVWDQRIEQRRGKPDARDTMSRAGAGNAKAKAPGVVIALPPGHKLGKPGEFNRSVLLYRLWIRWRRETRGSRGTMQRFARALSGEPCHDLTEGEQRFRRLLARAQRSFKDAQGRGLLSPHSPSPFWFDQHNPKDIAEKLKRAGDILDPHPTSPPLDAYVAQTYEYVEEK